MRGEVAILRCVHQHREQPSGRLENGGGSIFSCQRSLLLPHTIPRRVSQRPTKR